MYVYLTNQIAYIFRNIPNSVWYTHARTKAHEHQSALLITHLTRYVAHYQPWGLQELWLPKHCTGGA